MKCPVCGNVCRKGIIKAREVGSLTQFYTELNWYPEEEKNKLIKSGTVDLDICGEGYYCDECMKVFAVFKEK